MSKFCCQILKIEIILFFISSIAFFNFYHTGRILLMMSMIGFVSFVIVFMAISIDIQIYKEMEK